MTISKAYEDKMAEYSESLKFKQLPLLSWDIHMQNLQKLAAYRKDVDYIEKISGKIKTEVNILREFTENKSVIVITDLNLNIEFTSNNVVEMSGYQPREIIGNTPKMFQGPETDKAISKSIRTLVNDQQKFEYVLKNYKKDRSLYNCHIKGYPIYDKKGILIKYVAVEKVA